MRLPRAFLATLSLAVSTAVAGIMVGYFAGASGGVPPATGIIAIMGLMLAGLLTAFYGGRLSARGDRPSGEIQSTWEAFKREMDRARRFERPFILLRMAPLASEAREESDYTSRVPLSLVLRSVDHVWNIDGSMYVLLPEASGDAAMHLVERLRASMPGERAFEHVEIAEFPRDGVTTGSLIANLRPLGLDAAAGPMRLMRSGGPSEERTERTG